MSKNEKEISIKISGKQWEEALDKAYQKANKKTKIDGFRPGHAPKEVFLKKYGIESLYMDASQECIEAAYEKMLKDNKDLQIAAQPELSIKNIDEKHIEYVFKLTLKPEVNLGKYKDLKVKKEKVKVTKEEIAHSIDHMREHYKENVVKDGKIVKGDIAVIDFDGYKDGKAFDGGKGENYSLEIGSNTFIPGFEDQLIGLKAGDTKDVEVTFPEDYHSEELKGAKATFKVKVNEVKEVKIPELDKDFFLDLGMEGINTKEELEKQVEENIKASKEREIEDKYIDDLLAEVAKTTKIDIPDAMIHDEVDRMINQFAQQLQMQGITLDQFYKFTNSDHKALEEQYQEEAKKRVMYRLIIEEIIKAEAIKVTDKEVKAEIKKIADMHNMKEEDVRKEYGENIDYIKYDLEVRKVFDIMKGNN